MLARLAVLCPSQVLQRLDSLCEPLKVYVNIRTSNVFVNELCHKIFHFLFVFLYLQLHKKCFAHSRH